MDPDTIDIYIHWPFVLPNEITARGHPIHARTQAYTYARMHICTPARMHICTHAHMHARTTITLAEFACLSFSARAASLSSSVKACMNIGTADSTSHKLHPGSVSVRSFRPMQLTLSSSPSEQCNTQYMKYCGHGHSFHVTEHKVCM